MNTKLALPAVLDGSLAYDKQLSSNGLALSTRPERLGRLEPSDPSRPIGDLREQYAAQGYLWLRGILDRQRVLDFRRRYFVAHADLGLLLPGTDPTDGIYAGGDMHWDARVVMEIVRWAAFEAFCLAEPIVAFYEALFNGAPYLHKRKLLRHVVPGQKTVTGAHYDLVFLRGGTDKLCTSWIPIGDTPVQMGGLVYLEGSVPHFRAMEEEFAAAHAHLDSEERAAQFNADMAAGWITQDLSAIADNFNSRWLVADYEAGDMMVHSPYMIHAATSNDDQKGRMRLSTDIRYQLVSDEIDARWGNHWSLDDML